MAPRSILEKTVSGKLVRVFGNKAKFQALVSGFTDATADVSSPINFSRSGGSFRQYPGDPTPISRGGATVSSISPSPSYRSALPGRPFWLETTTGTGNQKVTVRRQFTFTGSFTNLKAAVEGGASGALVLRSPGGKAYEVADSTP